MTDDLPGAEAIRLERLWSSEFGNAYVERNSILDDRRGRFWTEVLTDFPIGSTLELGCGQGGNLRHIARILEPSKVWGIDVNEAALKRARANAPGVNVVAASARCVPFRDGLVDLSFTVGVLVHQPESTLPIVISEIVRTSRRFVLWIEYASEDNEDVPYHDEPGTLIKRNFGRIYHELFPELILRGEGFLGLEDGFDRGAWQLLEKP